MDVLQISLEKRSIALLVLMVFCYLFLMTLALEANSLFFLYRKISGGWDVLQRFKMGLTFFFST